MNIGQGSDRSMDKTTVSNYFRDEDDFKEALEVADRNADTETQMQFVGDCREKSVVATERKGGSRFATATIFFDCSVQLMRIFHSSQNLPLLLQGMRIAQ